MSESELEDYYVNSFDEADDNPQSAYKPGKVEMNRENTPRENIEPIQRPKTEVKRSSTIQSLDANQRLVNKSTYEEQGVAEESNEYSVENFEV